jgi:hypothetical protein
MKASKLVEIFSAYDADEEFIVDWLGKEEFEMMKIFQMMNGNVL